VHGNNKNYLCENTFLKASFSSYDPQNLLPSTRLDFYLWGHLKSAVYDTAVNDIAELQHRVDDGRKLTVLNKPGIFERVQQSFMIRTERCVGAQG
jgi:hypothetical protein